LSADRPNILVVNPNTSAGVTESATQALRAIAPDGVRLTGVTGGFGAQIVSTEAENVVAAYSALDLVARHAAGFDAIIMGISFDTAIHAVQSAAPVPAVGITQSALRLAIAGDRRVSVLFFGETSRGLYERVITGYGVDPISFHALDMTSVTDYLSPRAQDHAVIAAVKEAVDKGAEAVVICGAAILGMAARLQPDVSVPLYDGCAALETCLERLAGPGTGVHDVPTPIGRSEGIPDHIRALIDGSLFR